MRHRASYARWELALFAAFALLFSPGWENDRPTVSSDGHLRDLEARVLAPTVPEALVGNPLKVSRPEFDPAEQGPWPATGSLAVTIAVLALPLLRVRSNLQLRVERIPSPLAPLISNPRAPPAPLSA
jgi:hypothetical protein